MLYNIHILPRLTRQKGVTLQSRRQQSFLHITTHCLPHSCFLSAALHGVLGADWDLSQTKCDWERGLIVSFSSSSRSPGGIHTTLRQLHHTLKDSWSSQQRQLSGAQVGLLSVKHNSSLSLLLIAFSISVRYGGEAQPMGRSLWEAVVQ